MHYSKDAKEIIEIFAKLGKPINLKAFAEISMKKPSAIKSTLSAVKKRIHKQENTYNSGHIEEKYAINKDFIEVIQPNMILDLFCGINSFYKSSGYNVVTNDTKLEFDADYHIDAADLLKEYVNNEVEFDIVDVDPYNSPAPYIFDALKVAKKGIILTFGDHWSNIQYKKRDLIYNTYGFSYVGDKIPKKDFMEYQIKWCQKIAEDLGKKLEVFKAKEWWNPRSGDCPCYRIWLRVI